MTSGERQAARLLEETRIALERAVGVVLAEAASGRLITRATPCLEMLMRASQAVDAARDGVRFQDAVRDAPTGPAEIHHAFARGPGDLCLTCGKTWAGGHPPMVAPPIPDGPASAYADAT